MTNYKKHAETLFTILDDIDTLSDIAKGDNHLYRVLVEKELKKRFNCASTDGHTLKWK